MRSEKFWQYFDAEVRPHLGLRGETMGRIFDYLDRFDRPVSIVETVPTRSPEPWSADGGLTVLFDRYAECHAGSKVCAAIADEQTEAARRRATSDRVSIRTGDSVAILHALASAQVGGLEKVDLLYLGGREPQHDDAPAEALRSLKELLALAPLLREDTLVVVDHSPYSMLVSKDSSGALSQVGGAWITGNGKYIVEYAEQVRAKPCFVGYQCGWTHLRVGPLARAQAATVSGVITSSQYGHFAIGSGDDVVGRALRETGENAVHEVLQARKFLSESDDVLVVGAHVGTVAIGLAKHCRHVTAIEANPWTYKLLQCNVILNDATNVTALGFAASDKEETLRFLASTHNSGGSKRFPLKARPDYFYDDPSIVEVPARSLDVALADAEFALVFMDIEGSEYFAIQGMPRILSSARCLIVEYLPHHLSDVAGITPEEFAAAIAPHFRYLFIPSLKAHVRHDMFGAALRMMFDHARFDDGLIFTKEPMAA